MSRCCPIFFFQMFEQKSVFRIIILHLIAIFFVILNVSNIKIAGLSHVLPLFDLMAVFYFSIFRREFGIWFIFFMGVWNDALVGNPLGTTSLCYILLVKIFLVINQKMSVKENFQHVWRQFIIFCFLFLSIKWLLVSLLNSQFTSIVGVIVAIVLNSVAYVLVHKIFDYLSQKLLGENN